MSIDTETIVEERSPATAQAAALRALADLIEANPDLPAASAYIGSMEIWYGRNPAQVAAIARAGKACGATVTKDYGDGYFVLSLDFGGGVVAKCIGDRGTVCERVVTGTKQVTRTVPDPKALAQVPQIEVTETVETVEWRCEPILAAKGEVPAT